MLTFDDGCKYLGITVNEDQRIPVKANSVIPTKALNGIELSMSTAR